MKTCVSGPPDMCNAEAWKELTSKPYDMWCNRDKGHEGDHYDAFVGVSWGRQHD